MARYELWYDKAAEEWTEALPVGNGRLGAMVYGGHDRDHLQVNEATLWTGGPYRPVNPEAHDHLDDVRRLIFAGRYAEAQALADRHLMAKPHQQTSYQPAGDLWLDFANAEHGHAYRRSLDLCSALAATAFGTGPGRQRREYFASAADGVIVVRLTAEQGGVLDFRLRLTSEQPGVIVCPDDRTIEFVGHNRAEHGIPGQVRFVLRTAVRNEGGRVDADDDALRVSGAEAVTLLIDAATSFRRFDDVGGDPGKLVTDRLAQTASKPYAALKAAHIAEHRRLFDRFDLDLGTTSRADLPTNTRIAGYVAGDDHQLAALYVQYARYLMISCSRPGTQPATLQGLWNKETEPPWGSKYTSNINLQMNYWLPGPANLAECLEPVIAMAEDLSVTGEEMAKAHYGARGWVLHHNTDLWRATGPVDGAQWGLWPTGGAWLMAQLWDHWDLIRDDDLLARLYPLMHGAARFLLDVMVPLPGTDHLVTNPSLSPENVHPHGASLCAGPTMDTQIARDLFSRTLDAAHKLGRDAAFQDELSGALDRLVPHRIGHAGQLQEWLDDWDLDVPEINHRHVSHLYGVYPSWQINRFTTPELAAAARRSLEIRGDNATGWGIGWRINLWARLGDGQHAHDVLTMLLSPERTYKNLFDAHPPFQIDGNFGGAAGILEMLVQSRPGVLHLLPALPPHWRRGRIAGLRVRGGLELGMSWHDGTLRAARLMAGAPTALTVETGRRTCTLELAAGEARTLAPNDFDQLQELP